MHSLYKFVNLPLSQMFWQHTEIYSMEVPLGKIFNQDHAVMLADVY